MEKNVFEIMTEYGISEGIDGLLNQNEEYQQTQEKINELEKEFDALSLPEEQRLLIDRFVSSYNESGAFYGKVAYQQGVRDCALLLRKMGLIK